MEMFLSQIYDPIFQEIMKRAIISICIKDKIASHEVLHSVAMNIYNIVKKIASL